METRKDTERSYLPQNSERLQLLVQRLGWTFCRECNAQVEGERCAACGSKTVEVVECIQPIYCTACGRMLLKPHKTYCGSCQTKLCDKTKERIAQFRDRLSAIKPLKN